MLFPQHPQPVTRRRAVAEMTVACQQAATIAPGHIFEWPPATAPALAVPPPDVSPANHDTPI